jgi:hypothetical protein
MVLLCIVRAWHEQWMGAAEFFTAATLLSIIDNEINDKSR